MAAKARQIIVPYAAGGGSDTMARLFAQRFSAAWGKPFYVENVTGASGILAAEQVAQARPDGYTLFWLSRRKLRLLPRCSR